MKGILSHLLSSGLLATGIAIAASTLTTTSAQAFVINSQLTGDPRPGNPDNLIVDVTIATGADAGLAANQALWTIDLNSPDHPNIKLDGFFFNLANSIQNLVSFSGYNPAAWSVISPINNAQGSGSADFQFGLNDPPGNSNNVTNSQNLSFIMTSSGGALTLTDFLNAPVSTSNDNILGSGQMGTHLQSLNARPGESTSGFAFGDYEDHDVTVPEPGTTAALSLFALGSVGLLNKRKGNKELN